MSLKTVCKIQTLIHTRERRRARITIDFYSNRGPFERGAGNESPESIFHTDNDRTFFLVEFPLHPVFTEALKHELPSYLEKVQSQLPALQPLMQMDPGSPGQMIGIYGSRYTAYGLDKPYTSNLIPYTVIL